MKPSEIRSTGYWRVAVILTFAVGLMILSFSCKSPTSPNGDGEADIIVYSKIEDSLEIYMDGKFRFSIRYKNSIEIDNVAMGIHEMKARNPKTGMVVNTETIYVTEKIDYTWTIEDPADINVTNKYGQSLKIYMDDAFVFNLANDENRWIIDVPLGEHFLRAVRISDGKQAASITMNITKNKDYFWTIEKLKSNILDFQASGPSGPTQTIPIAPPSSRQHVHSHNSSQ